VLPLVQWQQGRFVFFINCHSIDCGGVFGVCDLRRECCLGFFGRGRLGFVEARMFLRGLIMLSYHRSPAMGGKR